MPPVIYKKQRQILDFLSQYMQSSGSAPTLSQIAQAIGVSSLATVHEHLQALEAKKLIKRTPGKNRSIKLVNSDLNFTGEKAVEVPILGFIAAGAPIEPHTDPNAKLEISPSFIKGNRNIYVLQVRGNSMIEEQIRDGDHVIIEATETANNGDIVVALLETGFATLKRFFKEATRIRLEPANAQMAPIFAKNVTIQGKVVGLIRRYDKNN
ncbi:MAG: transcriptional repressor LexA [Dehalococcoidales bacterium]|nr:transcriptional repressor LexA [Dehalococcoidales bacterium]